MAATGPRLEHPQPIDGRFVQHADPSALSSAIMTSDPFGATHSARR